jgi:hypothetical protein
MCKPTTVAASMPLDADRVYSRPNYHVRELRNWVDRGLTIRDGNTVVQCLSNLTVALEQLGQLVEADDAGVSGALSLLLAAG